MTTKQLEKLYEMACRGKGYEPNDGQFKLWKQTLGWCEEVDLGQALVWYFSENTAFPMPAELKPLSARSLRERTNKTKDLRWYVTWECPTCGFRMSGFLSEDADLERRCPSPYAPLGDPRKSLKVGEVCYGKMDVFSREDARNWKAMVRA